MLLPERDQLVPGYNPYADWVSFPIMGNKEFFPTWEKVALRPERVQVAFDLVVASQTSELGFCQPTFLDIQQRSNRKQAIVWGKRKREPELNRQAGLIIPASQMSRSCGERSSVSSGGSSPLDFFASFASYDVLRTTGVI